MDIEPSAILVLIGTIFGGVGLRFIDHLLSRKKVILDDAAVMRQELRDEVLAQRNEINLLEKQVVEWREKYFKILQEYSGIKAELEYALRRIKHQAEDAENLLPEIDTPPDDKS